MTLNFLMGPLVGGIIGYITNSVAIKMLFRPLKPIYIMGKRLPFTPGMIPKEQARIAKVVGEVVGRELVNAETLKAHLLSQEMVVKLERMISEWVVQQKKSTHTVEEAMQVLLGEKTVQMLSIAIEENFTKATYEKIVEMNLGEPLAKQAVAAIQGSLGPMAMLLGGNLMETAEVKLQEIIQHMIEEQGQEAIETIIIKEKQELMEMPVATIMAKLEDKLPRVKYIVLNQYTILIQNQLESMIKSINIAEIVENKIKDYDVLEMEKVILSIVNKELRAIVWLGALLGAIMGVIMNFF